MDRFKIPDWLIPDKKDIRLFHALTLLLGLYVLPIMLADRYYQDDLSRSLRGVTGWNNDGRPLTEQIIKWLCGGTPIGDIFPLTLILSVILLAYVLTLYIRHNLPGCYPMFLLLAVGFSVPANPFMLSSFSYRFDCITMVLALCAAVVVYALPQQYALWKVFCLSFWACMILLMTYQPCCGIYIALCALELFFMFQNAAVKFTRIIVRAGALCASVLVYYFMIMKHYIPDTGWQKSAYQFSFSSEAGFLDSVFQNLTLLGKQIDVYLISVPAPILTVTALLLIGGMLSLVVNIGRSGQSFRMIRLCYVILLPLLVIGGCMFPLLVLTPSNFSISVHSLIALCGFGLWSGVMLCCLPRRFDKLTALLLIPCMLFSFTLSYTYGNALKSQARYEEYLTYQIVHDLDTLNADEQYQYLTIQGRAPRSPETEMLCAKYPLLKHLIPLYITNNGYIGGALLQHYLSYDLEHESMTEETAALLETNTPAIHNAVYDCYLNADTIIICFHE